MIETDEINDTNHLASAPLSTRLFKGTSAQVFLKAVQIIIRLTEVPLLLGFWGAQLYGEWLMLTAIPAYLSMGDGGFTTAACRDIAMRVGAGDRRGALTVHQSTWVLLLILSAVVGVAAVIFMHYAPLHLWLNFSAMSDHETSLVFLLLVAHILLSFQGGLLNGGFWATARYPTGMSLIALIQLLEFGVMAIAVLLGGGPVQAALGSLIGRFIGTSLMWIGQHRVSPWLKLGFRHASFSELRRLTAPAFASLAFPLGNALNIQGMRLVVGLILGPAAVAVFVPLRTLSNLAIQPRAMVNRLLEPEMALAFGAENKALFRKLFLESCRISLWCCLAVALALIPSAIWLFPWWTGEKVIMHWPTYILLLVSSLANGTWYTALMVPYATNRHGPIAVYYTMVYGAVGLGLSYLWVSLLGLIGAPIALLLVEIAMAVIVIRASLQMVDISIKSWVKNILHLPYDIFFHAVLRLWRWICGYTRSLQNSLK